jgi:hypothetical protein
MVAARRRSTPPGPSGDPVGVDPLGLAGEQADGADAVAAEVADGAAAQLDRAADVAGRDADAEGGPDRGQAADGPVGDQLAGQGGLRVVTPHQPLDAAPPGRLGGVEAAGGVPRAGCERLLAQYVVARL